MKKNIPHYSDSEEVRINEILVDFFTKNVIFAPKKSILLTDIFSLASAPFAFFVTVVKNLHKILYALILMMILSYSMDVLPIGKANLFLILSFLFLRSEVQGELAQSLFHIANLTCFGSLIIFLSRRYQKNDFIARSIFKPGGSLFLLVGIYVNALPFTKYLEYERMINFFVEAKKIGTTKFDEFERQYWEKN